MTHHKITVTAVPNLDEDLPEDQYIDDGEYTRHGVFHQDLEGMWCTEGTQCSATHDDSCRDDVSAVAEYAGIGTHEIAMDYRGDGEWTVEIVHPPEVAAEILERAKAMLSKTTRANEWDTAPYSLRDYYRTRAWDDIRKERAEKP